MNRSAPSYWARRQYLGRIPRGVFAAVVALMLAGTPAAADEPTTRVAPFDFGRLCEWDPSGVTCGSSELARYGVLGGGGWASPAPSGVSSWTGLDVHLPRAGAFEVVVEGWLPPGSSFCVSTNILGMHGVQCGGSGFRVRGEVPGSGSYRIEVWSIGSHIELPFFRPGGGLARLSSITYHLT